MTTPVLLIHGLFGSLSDPTIVAAFSNSRVLAPDPLGYGAYRESAPATWTLDDQADQVAPLH